jgi:hypothetical protein
MPDIVFMDMDGNETRKNINDINSIFDLKKAFAEHQKLINEQKKKREEE